MLDRIVRKIYPRSGEAELDAPSRFSNFSSEPNIVLLGDPGSGKTHLLRAAAAHSGGKYLTTRAFLNDPTIAADAALFIDALDEKRAGKSDQATVDSIVQKLFLCRPRQVRLASRLQDWLGGTDLAVFRPYFDQSGGVVVLQLAPLTEEEQRAVLLAHDVGNPVEFVEQAKARGLVEFLQNPQNLVMLVEAVKAGSWPASRRMLFEVTSELLLKEHNVERTRRGGGIYSAQEIRIAAGAACALRLISDVGGVSLSEAERDPELPSYRSIPFSESDRILAALERRAFVAIGEEIVDYAHRTRAEYLGAEWLAKRIDEGLSVGRVRALLGVDGVPAPELRGLHAWLAIHSPRCAGLLIETDPFGILVYADAGALSPSHRKMLVESLARHALADPSLRSDGNGGQQIGALATEDMIPHISALLQSPVASFGVKTILLDALSVGKPLPSLLTDVMSVLADVNVVYGLKYPAIKAAIRMGGQVSLVNLYRTLGESANDIRLRADLLKELYRNHFEAKDVAKIISDAINCREELVGGILWRLADIVSINDITTVLDAINIPPKDQSVPERPNETDVLQVVDDLVERAILGDGSLSGRQLANWLRLRRKFRNSYSYHYAKDIKKALSTRPSLVKATFSAVVDDVIPERSMWAMEPRLLEWMPFALAAEPLHWLAERVVQVCDAETKRQLLYQICFGWAYQNAVATHEIFELLYDLGDSAPELLETRSKVLSCSLENNWRLDHTVKSKERELNQERMRKENRLAFERDRASIASGEHRNWLNFIGRVYFAAFSDVDRKATPRERLAVALGHQNVDAALEGLRAALFRADHPTVHEISLGAANNSYPYAWYSWIAGMDEVWTKEASFLSFSDELLRAQIALNLVLPTTSRRGDSEREDEHSWKDALVKDRPAMFVQVYLEVAREGLRLNSEHVPGIYNILYEDALVSSRANAALSILRDFPGARPNYLEDLLQVAVCEEGARPSLMELARTVLSDASKYDADQIRLWTVAAYLLSPNEFEARLASEAAVGKEIVWALRALTGYESRSPKGVPPVMQPMQIEAIIAICGAYFPSAGYPTGGWGGDRNPWDASEFIRHLINQLAADRSERATEALLRLLESPLLSTYSESLKLAVANQKALRRQAAYVQPNWQKAIATLQNRQPANAADLHALVLDQLIDLNAEIGSRNNDIYKQFWNEDSFGRITTPKVEESCRDVLLGMLRERLRPLGIVVEPEGHMVADKRADISVALTDRKSLIELKRDSHSDVWVAHETQLERFYARDHDADGFGIYGVFWFGRPDKIARYPSGAEKPHSANDMLVKLEAQIAPSKRERLHVIVINVEGPSR